MNEPNVTTDACAACLRILQSSNEPLVAAELAVRLQLAGNRETQRRHIRAIVKHLRDNGSMIIATLTDGYWLTEDDGLWRDYNEGRQIDAKKIFAETHKRKMLMDQKGQGVLFRPMAWADT
jgi:hypothetical protein